MNAQKLIKDRVVCPAGAWYPGDLTTRPLIHPLSLPPLTRSPRGPPYHRSHTLSSIYKRRREHCVDVKRKHRRTVGLIDRPLFLPGRPQKLKTTIYPRNLQCTSVRVFEGKLPRRSTVFPEFSHQRALIGRI